MIYRNSSQIDFKKKKNNKKVVSWHYPKLQIKMAIVGAKGIGISYYGNQFFFIPMFIENYQ